MNLECIYWCSFGLMFILIKFYLNVKMLSLVVVVLDDNKKLN